MADFDDFYDDFAVTDFRHEPVLSDAVPQKPRKVLGQAFAEYPWVFRPG
jgi:hypothetical protein